MRENGSFRFGPEQPAPFSHLIVDEATMVDAYLMEAAVAALPADAALILVGDPGQLPSVGPGQVFTDLVAVAQQVGNPSLISLERPFRFEATGTISAFAEAVLTGDVSETFKLLRRGDPALGWLPPPETEAEWNDWATPLVSHARELQASFERHLASGSEPANPWELLGKQVVLTPLRRGPAGAQFLNQLILNQLADTGPAGTLPVGTPMLTTRNHPALELWNGDAGLLDEDGLIHFGAGKRVSRASLGDAVTAHAITVHRSQGSEYECAALVLPSTPHPLVTRELLFTAVSRARKQLTVYASEASLVAALEHSEVRSSGLRGKLIANATDQS
jgi:exodeoxyribonuclease V alpha subunit